MINKISLTLLWIIFIVYAFLFAPPNDPHTLDLIRNLSTGALDNINPYIIALFNLMGILPMIYGSFLLIDGVSQKIPAWLFLTGSFFLGAFALIPYLIFRENNPTFTGEKNWLIKLADSRLLGIILTLVTTGLIIFGVSQGNGTDFILQWQSSRFINVMSLDFCLLSVLFPVLLKNDMEKRGIYQERIFWLISLIPLFGVLIYLCWRSPLKDNQAL
jgi:Ni,Fe-hydrogenase I cytochrome b subunit